MIQCDLFSGCVPLDVFLTHLCGYCTDVCKEKTKNTMNSKMFFKLGVLKTYSFSKANNELLINYAVPAKFSHQRGHLLTSG